MKGIKNKDTYTFKETIKKSLFITIIEVISSKYELESFINKYFDKDATHNVYAYSYVENGKTFSSFKEDGEPHGTAGKAILNIIDKQDIQNIIVFVKRYYGGIKLGPGGLSRAYCSGFINLLKTDILLKEIEDINLVTVEYKISNTKDLNLIINSLSPIDIKNEYNNDICTISFYTSFCKEDIESLLRNFKKITITPCKR